MSSMKPSKFDLVEDLRNFSVHYAIPPATLTTMWHGSGGQPMQWGERRRTRHRRAAQVDKCSDASRRYIETHDGNSVHRNTASGYDTKSIGTHQLSGLPGQAPW